MASKIKSAVGKYGTCSSSDFWFMCLSTDLSFSVLFVITSQYVTLTWFKKKKSGSIKGCKIVSLFCHQFPRSSIPL
jgi:hypothetical protein